MRTDDNYLRWQFGRWAKEHAPNVTLVDAAQGADGFKVGDLLPGESVVASIALTSGDPPLVVTSHRLIRGDRLDLPYGEVRQCIWIDRDPKVKTAQKQTHYDRVILETVAGVDVVLDGLDQAVFPLLKFFWFKLRVGAGGRADR